MPRKPPKRKTVPEKIAKELDRELLDVLKNGTPAFDAAGHPVIDPKTGEQVRKRPTAAHLTAALRRLEHAGHFNRIEQRNELVDFLEAQRKAAKAADAHEAERAP